MKKILLLLTVLFTVGAMAQDITLTAGSTIKSVPGPPGTPVVVTVDANGNGEIILNDKTTIRGNSSVSGFMSIGQQLTITGKDGVGLVMGNTKITNLAKAVNDTDAVNLTQLKEYFNNQPSNLDKATIIKEANTNTDNKVGVLADTVTKQVKRLDKRIDATNEAVNTLDRKVNTQVSRLDTRIDNVLTYVGNEFRLVNNRIEGLGAMTAALSAAATSSIYNASKPTNLNIATGFYGRASALAVGVSHFFNSNTKVSVNWSQGSATKSAIGIGAGFSF